MVVDLPRRHGSSESRPEGGLTSAELPAPPYPADTKAKGWRFELDYERIEQSGTWNEAGALALEGLPLARVLLLAVWYAAWKQVPCGSLPADDTELAGCIGLPRRMFADYREVLLRGWYVAADGRLYHPVLTERVLEMMSKRRGTADRVALHRAKKLQELIDRDGGACVYCGTTDGLTIDHMLPKKRGGDSDPLNLAAACKPCNSSKKERTPEEAGMVFWNPAASARWASYKEQRTGNVDVTVTQGDVTPMYAPCTTPTTDHHRNTDNPPSSLRSEGGSSTAGSSSPPSTDPPARKTRAKTPIPDCPYERIVEAYHEVLPELPRVRVLDDKRKAEIRRVWVWVFTSRRSDGSARATDSDSGVAWFRGYFGLVRSSDFLLGRSRRSAGYENWRCSIDYLVSNRGLKHVIEGLQ